MSPAGRGRLCGRCDRIVHDLSDYELGEAEALLRREPEACVRARIGADGAIALKPPPRGTARRMVIAAAATAGLLAGASPALAGQDRPVGAIAGKVGAVGPGARVTATGSDGRRLRARTKSDGRFRIKGVPAGIYTLTVSPGCGESWTIENVVVGTGETVVADDQDRVTCITVGRLEVEEDRA